MMSNATYEYVPDAALTGSMRDFRVPGGTDLLARTEGFFRWQNTRRQSGVWPFSRATQDGPRTICQAQDDRGIGMRGVNFASQDYLSMSSHPQIKATALEVIEQCGVHSAGSPALVGNTSYSVALERKIADFLKMEEVVLYPTGWAAGFGVIKGLVRSSDHIVMDMLSHACLQEGAHAATHNIYQFRHLDNDYCRRLLQKIRAKDTENGILVVTEGLFSMDSDTPNLVELQELCHEFNATLVVDVAHDLGSLGEDGRGHIGIQNMLGKIDIVMGSFSKTFASNGGFVACKNRAVKEYLRFFSSPATFSNAMSPMQAACVLKAFEIIDSAADAARGRFGLLRRSVGDRLRQDGHRRIGPSRQPSLAGAGPARQPRRVSGRAEGRRALPHAGDGEPHRSQHPRCGRAPQARQADGGGRNGRARRAADARGRLTKSGKAGLRPGLLKSPDIS
jgi:glycine C-acetyltransferase